MSRHFRLWPVPATPGGRADRGSCPPSALKDGFPCEESDGVFPALSASSCEAKESGAASMSDERNWVDLSGHGFSVSVAEFVHPPGSRLVLLRGVGQLEIGRASCRERGCQDV